MTVTSLTNSGAGTLLDLRYIYQYTGVNLFPWGAITPMPDSFTLSHPTSGNQMQYIFAPFITYSLASTSGGAFVVSSGQYSFSFTFPIVFPTSPATGVVDALWVMQCQRFDLSSNAWTTNDVSTVQTRGPNPWNVVCSTKTLGTLTVAAYYNSTYIPPPSTSSSTGAADVASSAGNTGAVSSGSSTASAPGVAIALPDSLAPPRAT